MIIIKTITGQVWRVPHLGQLEMAADDNCGFCRQCGTETDGLELDANSLDCTKCGGDGTVFGAGMLWMMGWFYDGKNDAKWSRFNKIIG